MYAFQRIRDKIGEFLDIRPFGRFPNTSVGSLLFIVGVMFIPMMTAIQKPHLTLSKIKFVCAAIIILGFVAAFLIEQHKRKRLTREYKANPYVLDALMRDDRFVLWMRLHPGNQRFRRKYDDCFTVDSQGTRVNDSVPLEVRIERAVTYDLNPRRSLY